MDNITTGHWIFAGIFAVAFIIFLVWSYIKDYKLNKTHYKGSSLFLLSIILIGFLLYVFRGFMQ